MAKTFSELLSVLADDQVLSLSGEARVNAPCVENAADVQPGGVFVARRGRHMDGHDFIAEAVERGAAAVVGERAITGLPVAYARVQNAQTALGWLAAAYYDFPSRRLIVTGVTGTDGKTTTSTLIHSILNVATQGRAGLISTLAADLGSATADTGLHVTTPAAPQVQAFLAQMVANGLTHCVLEMTSHGLAQGRLNGVDLDVAVLTNVTHEHLDYHGTFEQYRAAKGIMFDMLASSFRKLGPSGEDVPKVSVINLDDASAEYFAGFTADHLVTYAIHRPAQFRATNIRYDPDRTWFTLPDYWSDVWEEGLEREFSISLVGEFNVLNAAAAAAATFHQIDAETLGAAIVWDGFEAVTGVSGRMERIDEGQAFTAIVDFAHTPNALKNVLQAARRMLPQGQRLIAVFGSAGLRDVEKRRLMAEVSAQLADFTILTAEDPRTESLDTILQMMADGCTAQGGVEGETFARVPDRGEALLAACQMAQPGDIVIACGKGHEQSMCFGVVEYPWDDRAAMRAALRGQPLSTLPTAR